MAIILEQKKKPLGSTTVVVGVLVLCVLGLGAYFLFFLRGGEPQKTSQGDATGGITKINKDEFINLKENKTFSILQQYPRLNPDTIKMHLGKTDPFQKF
ncbi:MAG: hypothetical protein HZA36_03045 [Parcubacteria group bacterium]|nr:hypothetical protein [Parcubacteria group bacterium]